MIVRSSPRVRCTVCHGLTADKARYAPTGQMTVDLEARKPAETYKNGKFARLEEEDGREHEPDRRSKQGHSCKQQTAWSQHSS